MQQGKSKKLECPICKMGQCHIVEGPYYNITETLRPGIQWMPVTFPSLHSGPFSTNYSNLSLPLQFTLVDFPNNDLGEV